MEWLTAADLGAILPAANQREGGGAPPAHADEGQRGHTQGGH